MVISCLGQTVFAFDTFIAVGSSCFWKSISWRSSVMTSQPIRRFFKFEAVSTRKFFNLRGEFFWLSSHNHFNFVGEKQTPRTVLSSVCIWKLKQHTFSNEIYCRNPFTLLQAVIQLLKPVNSPSTSAHSTLTQESNSNNREILDYSAPTMLHHQFRGLRSADHCLTQQPNAVFLPLYKLMMYQYNGFRWFK